MQAGVAAFGAVGPVVADRQVAVGGHAGLPDEEGHSDHPKQGLAPGCGPGVDWAGLGGPAGQTDDPDAQVAHQGHAVRFWVVADIGAVEHLGHLAASMDRAALDDLVAQEGLVRDEVVQAATLGALLPRRWRQGHTTALGWTVRRSLYAGHV